MIVGQAVPGSRRILGLACAALLIACGGEAPGGAGPDGDGSTSDSATSDGAVLVDGDAAGPHLDTLPDGAEPDAAPDDAADTAGDLDSRPGDGTGTRDVDVPPDGGECDPEACDDGLWCTDDQCEGDACIHPVVEGACLVDGACVEAGDSAPDDACAVCDPTQTVQAWSPALCDDENPCTADTCDPDEGCVHAPDDELPCDDGLACTTDDHCDDGVCKATPCPCETDADCAGDESPLSPCTKRACVDESCKVVADPGQDGEPCDTGYACVEGTTCGGGVCGGGEVVDCSAFDEGPCFPAVCDPVEGCRTDTLEDGATCDDGDPCTEGDTCEEGVCSGEPVICDDGDVCNGLETCDPVAGCVDGEPLVCGDGDPCTGTEVCDPAEGCVPDQPPCDDGNVCNGVETCDADGQCHPGEPLECDDGNVCNGVETCDPIEGCVAGTPLECGDGNVCNGLETCDPVEGCVDGEPLECDDGNVCNGLEPCHPKNGCLPGTPIQCDDGNACNGLETCDPVDGCQAGAPPECDDGDVCNGVETCDPDVGCVDGVPLECDDGDACNGLETCDPVDGCQAGTPPACDDGDVCNGVETCDPDVGCVDGVAPECGPFVCAPSGCLTSCEDDADCAEGRFCDTHDLDGDGDHDDCVLLISDGGMCADTDGSECAAGRCANGYCCSAGTCCASDGDCPWIDDVQDQSQTQAQAGVTGRIDGNEGAGQEIVAGIGGKLTEVEGHFRYALSDPGTVTLRVYGGSLPGQGGQLLATATADVKEDKDDYTFTFASPPTVEAGETYFLLATGEALSGGAVLWYGTNVLGAYPDGLAYFSENGGGTWEASTSPAALAFRTLMRSRTCRADNSCVTD